MSTTDRINQSELPLYSLKDALRIATPIHEEYAGMPVPPIDLAIAVNIKPTSSRWRYLTGAAIGYGLIDGGSNAARIGLTDLGRRAVAPTSEGEDRAAWREAVLRPSVFRGFLTKYDGNKFPRDLLAKNVLQAEFGVPPKRLDSALALLIENGDFVGFYRQIGGDRYVSLSGTPASAPVVRSAEADDEEAELDNEDRLDQDGGEDLIDPTIGFGSGSNRPRHVFVGHSKNSRILDQVKQMLELGDFVPEIAVEQETGAIPVPEKVFEAMRRCGAAIICVTADAGSEATDGKFAVNPNVLIEIGAAYVYYDRRVILLWDRRVVVPSNLQGLYRCEFEGTELSWEAGTKIQKALLAFKKGEPLPTGR